MPAKKKNRCIYSQHHHWNCVIPPENLLPVLALAWQELYAKQGLPVPEPRGQTVEIGLQQQPAQAAACPPPPEQAACAPTARASVEAMLTGERLLMAGVLAVWWVAARLRQRPRPLRSAAQPLKA